MPEKQRLRDLLDDLHRELGDADAIDDESRAQLQETLEEIRAALEPEAASGGGMGRRLQELALRFETDHPRIAATIRQLTDSLAKMGI